MPRLACVVLSYRSEPTLVEAVRSIVEQAGDDVEVVVVNSGGGPARAELERARLDVDVVDVAERWYVGKARNAGVAATSAPFVAFLAADCLAEPGWVEGRLRAHEAGAAAVASAVTNASPHSPFAWASYLDLFKRRMPTMNPDPVLYGASYARTLFPRYGLFREDLETGEDTEFHARFRGEVEVVWAPDVRSAHHGPVGPWEFVRDQYRRGRRAGRYYLASEGDSHWRLAARWAWPGWKRSATVAWRLQRGHEHRLALLGSVVVQPVGIVARIAGLATAGVGAGGVGAGGARAGSADAEVAAG